jgi:competence protein CoiA
MIDDTDEIRQREAGETGCFGLVPGRASQLYTQELFNASDCEKGDGPFYCPDCISDAVVRKCTQKRDHFAHRARLSPVIGPNESELHRQCKNELVRLLRERFPSGNWELERCIAESPEKRTPELRPDVSGRINRVPIAIEVQASTLTVGKIVKRATIYEKRHISLVVGSPERTAW